MNHHRHTHLVIFFASVLLLLASRPAQGQQRFTVIRDTVYVNDLAPYNKMSETYLTNIRKYRDYYFCIFRESFKFEHNSCMTLLAISLKDGTSKIVEKPEDINDLWNDNLFIWNDTLYLVSTDYNHNKKGYRFDYDKWQWHSVSHIPNYFYEDENYYVVPRSNVDLLFVDKNTTWYPETKNGWLQMEPVNRPYLNHFAGSRIIRTKDHYLFIRRGKIDSLPISRPGEPGHENTLGKIFEEFRFYPTSKWVFEGDPTNYGFQCGLGNSHIGYREPILDTVFHNALYVNDRLYFIITVQDRTFIARKENGVFREVQPLFQNVKIISELYDNDLNRAPNSCHLHFSNSTRDYGTVDIEDTTVFIRCFLYHHQEEDSLPIVPDNATEPILDFLLHNLPDISLSKLDSCEQQLSEVGLGRFIPLNNGYFPIAYQNDKKYAKYPYYRILDDGLVCRRAYCVHKQDSVVKAVFIEWGRSYYGPHGWDKKDWNEEIKGKCEEVSDILTQLTGTKPEQDYQIRRKWTYNGLTIKLYDYGCMVIY